MKSFFFYFVPMSMISKYVFQIRMSIIICTYLINFVADWEAVDQLCNHRVNRAVSDRIDARRPSFNKRARHFRIFTQFSRRLHCVSGENSIQICQPDCGRACPLFLPLLHQSGGPLSIFCFDFFLYSDVIYFHDFTDSFRLSD